MKSINSDSTGAPILIVTSLVRIPVSELHFRTSRSSGPGGQNVNKLETRVELLFDIVRSPSLTDEQRERILLNLGSRIDGDGVLHISSQRSRSQWENKQGTIEKLVSLLREVLKVRRKRIKTAPTRSSNETRVQQKKKHSQKKKLRRVHVGDE
jgi:ribosome-associated protein